MVKLPNWKDLKNRLEDPQRREELLENVQRGVDRGRENAAKKLSGPAAHLRNVGSQFKSGLTETDEPAAPPSAPPAAAPPAATPPAAAPPADAANPPPPTDDGGPAR
jgi:hypothetical protein